MSRLLAPHTTLGLGGPATRLETATTESQLVDLVRSADAAGQRVLLLGGGSNVVIGDKGFDGTAILVRTEGVDVDAPTGFVRASAGEPWDRLVATTVERGLAGIEALSGIPGSTGATPLQNVGAYGQSVSDTIEFLDVFDREKQLLVRLSAEQCEFAYRSSRLKAEPGRFVVLGVAFRLARSDLSVPVRYEELARALGISVGDRAPLPDVRAAVLVLRAGKGMVLAAGDPDTRSVGSFFTNPVVDASTAVRVREIAGSSPPQWNEEGGRVKLSAAWLVQRSGFDRGYGTSGARVSSKHTLALTARAGGSTRELLALADDIRQAVHGTFGIRLELEPTLVGTS